MSTFRCVARHDVLNGTKSGQIKLVVEVASELISQEPPKFLFPSDYDVQQTLILDDDEDHTLDCLAYSVPAPIITWVLTYEIGRIL